MRVNLIYFLGLSLLIAGIVFLNAQEEGATNNAGQAAPAAISTEQTSETTQASSPAAPAGESAAKETLTSTVTETSATTVAAPAETTAAAAASVETTPAPAAAETTTTTAAAPAETNAMPAQPQTEEKKEQAAEQPKEQPKTEAAAGAEKEPAKDVKPLGFEIDRGSAAKKTGGTEDAKKSETEIKASKPEDKAARKEAAAEKPARRGILWGLFDSKKDVVEETKAGADKEKGKEREAKATGEEGQAEMSPVQLLAVQEEVRRQEKELQGLKKFDQARQEMDKQDFVKALKSYGEGLAIMPVRPHTVEIRQKAMQSEAECEYRLALNDYKEGKVPEARAGIRRALEYYPAHAGAARLSDQIRRDEKRLIDKKTEQVLVRRSPEYLDKRKLVKSEIRRGLEYLDTKEYDKAENEFTKVLAEDRFDADASAGLRKVAEKRERLETDEFERVKAEMLAQIKATWIPSVKKVATGPVRPIEETIKITQAKQRLEAKLDNIIIPELKFNEANIEDVIEYLHQQSIAGDKDSAPGDRGVNIIMASRPAVSAGAAPGAAAPAAATTDNLFATEEAKPAAAPGGGSGAKISLSVTQVPLREALKYITEFTGYKYRVEERAVIIHRADEAYGKVETRTYKIQPAMVETIMGGAGAAQPAESSERLEISSAGPATAERADMKQFFINAGVPFPGNTSITYIPAQTLLIVKNTVENFEEFEKILNKLNIPTMLVEIEARFVEIKQTDLEELGLEWILTDNWELAEKSSGLPKSMRERVQMNKGPITKGLRELNNRLGVVEPGGQLGNIASISSILTNPELTVILHALQQRDGINLLSAPKVTTRNGSPAEIKVVQELIYPTEYQQQAQSIGTTTSGNQSLVQIVVTPSAFETRDLGVILGVTPTVGPDNETIDLAMNPQVVELIDWKDYGFEVPTSDPSRVQIIHLNQPIFASRSITTAISIYDGQTVVMGGLITEGQVNSEDKVPLLGDIPLLGYLFKSTVKRSEKRNLLIFVTATLVDPGGNKIKKGQAPISLTSGATTSATP